MRFGADVLAVLDRQAIEVPSWAYGNSGTRFKVFAQAGVPRDPFEKLTDAAPVHALTGFAPTVALHIRYDEVDDFGKLCEHSVRQAAIDHDLRCIEIMHETGSRDLKIWPADGTNYPGQDDLRARQDRRRARGSCEGVPRHRSPCAGHEHRVHRRPAVAAWEARLVRLQLAVLRRRRPDRRRGRPVPAVPDPARGQPRGGFQPASGVVFMLDQCHNIEPKIPGQIRSALNVQEMTARAARVGSAEAAALGNAIVQGTAIGRIAGRGA